MNRVDAISDLSTKLSPELDIMQNIISLQQVSNTMSKSKCIRKYLVRVVQCSFFPAEQERRGLLDAKNQSSYATKSG